MITTINNTTIQLSRGFVRGGATELLGEGVVLPGGGLSVGVELDDGVGVGLGGLLIAYSAASMIIPLVLSMSAVLTRPFSSMPSEYPLVGLGSLDSTYEAMFLVC